MNRICSTISNKRLDVYISEIFNISRRKAAFLINNGHVKVNNRTVQKSYLIKKGDILFLNLKKFGTKLNYDSLKIVWENNRLMAIYKPEKFHSAKLFKSQYSVEDYIESLNNRFVLLNRLDYNTSGILLVSKDDEFSIKYKEIEENLEVEKFYIGVLKNRLEKYIVVQNSIDSKHRKKVKVLSSKSNENITHIEPIAIYRDFSIANIKIFKGARHQIRAHLSYIKFPLLFDALYNDDVCGDTSDYFLFCYRYRVKSIGIDISIYHILKDKLRKFLEKIV